MGICFPDAEMLWEAHKKGVSFKQTLTIGHNFLFLHPAELKALRAAHLARSGSAAPQPLADYQFGEYSDRFFQEFLGATQLEILDYSAYEGATTVHDLNRPVPDDLVGRFDAVVDSGSLEHVFNFPVAIENLMRMTKVGGSTFITTPANNLCGHGFYQFSPELMFRIFSRENGYELKQLVFLQASFAGVQLTPFSKAYRVVDPAKVRQRVGLRSRYPVMMMVEATKTEDVRPFSATPQQSDYMALWNNETASAPAGATESMKRFAKSLPRFLSARIHGHYLNWKYSFANKEFYKKL